MVDGPTSARTESGGFAPGDGGLVGRWLFIRGLGLVYLFAFGSLWSQLSGLIGTEGIAPADLYLGLLEKHVAQSDALSWWQFPTLSWFLGADETTLHILAAAGCALSIGLVAGVLPRVVLAGLWAIYLSFFTIASPFLNYQWDILLLEVGAIAVFYAPGGVFPSLRDERAPSVVATWLLRIVLFKLIWSSGMVKLNSNDPSWQDLTALDYHYWTQPIPHQLAWYAHNASDLARQAGVVMNHFVELFIPWLILFTPRRWFMVAWFAISGLCLTLGLGDLSLLYSLISGIAALILSRLGAHDEPKDIERAIPAIFVIILMISVGATGNYGFFNLLTIVLAFVCLGDRLLYRVTPTSLLPRLPDVSSPVPKERVYWRGIVIAAALVLVPLNGLRLVQLTSSGSLRSAKAAVEQGSDAWSDRALSKVTEAQALSRSYLGGYALVNGYGLFARMTKERFELIVEGSHDQEEWRAYRFQYKPDTTSDLNFAGLHMPRLDWQMWFAALYPKCSRPWFFKFMDSLLEGSKSVHGLLENNPFPNGPPTYLRVRRVSATFSADTEGETEPGPWVFREASDYCPVVSRQNLPRSASGRRRADR